MNELEGNIRSVSSEPIPAIISETNADRKLALAITTETSLALTNLIRSIRHDPYFDTEKTISTLMGIIEPKIEMSPPEERKAIGRQPRTDNEKEGACEQCGLIGCACDPENSANQNNELVTLIYDLDTPDHVQKLSDKLDFLARSVQPHLVVTAVYGRKFHITQSQPKQEA